MKPQPVNHALVYGEIDDAILDRAFEIAHGSFREDKRWRNTPYTGETFLDMISRFARGPKDGPCILQGAVVAPSDGKQGVQRQAKNVLRNSLIMLDHDTGATVNEIAEQVAAHKLACVLWTTHSHMKPHSVIAEAKVLQWLKTSGVKTAGEPSPQQVLEFLRQAQKMAPKYLEGAVVEGRELIEGGRKYKVRHQPLPRVRSLFFLQEDFDFATRAGSQKQVIDEWKSLYAGVSVMLGLPFDPSCVDPSRLMYLPRVAPEANLAEHEIRIIAGGLIDLTKVAPVVKTRGASPAAPITLTPHQAGIMKSMEANGGATKNSTRQNISFQTPGLADFLKREGRFFRASDFMYATRAEDERHDYGDGKRDFRCPNEDDHSDAKEDDRGFFVTNYSHDGSDGHWNMRCPHTTCLAASSEDRAWYLDRFCVENEIAHANELHEFCDLELLAEEEAEQREKAEARRQEHEAHSAAARNDTDLDARVNALGPLMEQGDPAFIEAAVNELKNLLARRLLVCPTDTDRVDTLIGQIAQITKRRVKPLREAINILRKELEAEFAAVQQAIAEAAVEHDPSQVPPEPGKLHEIRPLWPGLTEEWTDDLVAAAMKAQLERANQDMSTPRLYRRPTFNNEPDPGIFRITVHPDDDQVMVQEVTYDSDVWKNELARIVQFKKVTLTGGRRPMSLPDPVFSIFKGAADKRFPVFEKIIRVPIFTEDGQLMTARGYIKEMKMFLDPSANFKPVPPLPSAEQVEAAKALFSDALTDFPFSDQFDGNERLPIKVPETDAEGRVQRDGDGNVIVKRDAEGHPLPNRERGKGSYANMLALILQPFVQNLIKGPSPAFHIDKASPGTGAGYLVDVVFCIAEGKRATIRVMSDNNEEFKKAITATLRKGDPIIFVDNINRKVDSGAFAAALTSGTWSDRVLGETREIEMEVKSVWVLAGNNLSFSKELMRRNVPIRLDAKTPNPAADRDQTYFKHFPLQDWLLEHRPELAQAAHILIANWFAKGKPRGKAILNSFDHWSMVLGGILEAAGIEGFLSNVAAYINQRDEDGTSSADYVKALWERFKEFEFDNDAAFGLAKNTFGMVQFGLPIDGGKTDASQKMLLGKHISSQLATKTFEVEVNGTPTLITWVSRMVGGNKKHRFSIVSDAG